MVQNKELMMERTTRRSFVVQVAAGSSALLVSGVMAQAAVAPKLEEKDLFTRFALFTALNRIGKADSDGDEKCAERRDVAATT